ncbi:phage tail protein [Aristophania vespae]|uniref:Phage tail protein n=1 Tax=Aristophania vespae TaxID=2697033 RepID=A0A6P1NGN2_9PROT|nr:phage tail sheath subtilisin-like domain-containing protein [Aristophania vespae]QHI96057.1 phage tail protein [Aristophania vespae]UMM63824.1 hypothetical protein DM15PD_08010 [Aristophania vespae]
MPDFQEIPGEWPVPGSYTEVSYVPAPGTLAGMPVRPVIIGQTSKKEAAGILHHYITAGQAEQIYGKGSILAQAVRTFIDEKPTLGVDVIGAALADDAVAASATISFEGTASAATTAALIAAGVRLNWTVNVGASAADIATGLINAAQTSKAFALTGLKLALGSDKKSVTVTAGEAGALGNDFDIRYSSAFNDQIAGVTVKVTAMQGGTGVADISDALLALGESWYTDLILCQTDSAAITAAVAEANRRKDAMVAKDMRVVVGLRATQGQALALQQNFSTSEELVLLPLSNPRCSPWQIGAALGAQLAQSLNNDPARQLRTLPLNTLAGLGPETSDQFSDTQRSVLLGNGCSTVTIAQDGTVTLERVITARVSDPQTHQSVGVWDVMIPAIAARVRYEWNSYVNKTYARSKLADDHSPLSSADGVVTTRTLKASWIAQCLLYQNRGWIDDVATTGPQSVFERNTSDRSRVDSSLPILPMGSLTVLANSLQLQV